MVGPIHTKGDTVFFVEGDNVLGEVGKGYRIAIETLAVLSGDLPARAMGLVVEWATLHRRELQIQWQRASALQSLGRIEPLP